MVSFTRPWTQGREGLFVATSVRIDYQRLETLMKRVEFPVLVLAVSVGILATGTACRKRNREAAPPASETSAAPTPATPSAPATASAPVPAMSAKDQATVQQRFMSQEVTWTSKTPDQKKMAYYGWCQQFMFGDAAAKTRVLAEIRKAGLPPADLAALKAENAKLGFPPLPL